MNKTKTERLKFFKSGKIELPDKSFAGISGKQIRGEDGCWIQRQVSRVETLTSCFARIYKRLIRAENCVTEPPKSFGRAYSYFLYWIFPFFILFYFNFITFSLYFHKTQSRTHAQRLFYYFR